VSVIRASRYASETGATDVTHVEPVLPTQQKSDQGETPPPETRRGDPDGALATAEVKIDQTYVIPRENHNPIEMHATIAAWDGDRLTLWDKTQWVNNVADEIAAVFGLAAENVRVVSPFVGGAFGSGLRTWPHVTLAALGARVAGRPVKLMLSRREMYYGVGYRPHTVQRVVLGAARDGRLTALVHEGHQETSSYEEFSEALLNASRFLHSCPNVTTRHRIAPMNVHTPTYMRAPGEASGVFALESAMDELAVALNVDPVELRLRNEPEQDEFKKLPFSSRSTRECYRAAAERFGWSRRNPEPRSMRDGRWLIGWGMATATYPMNYAPASAMARLLPDGTAEVASAASDMGPGTWTSMTQVAAETLGLPIERVKFTLGDTRLPKAPVHGGSMTMASVGSAVQAACRKAREDALARGGANDLNDAMRRIGQPVEATADVKPGDESQRFSMHSFGAVFVEVAVDPELGETRVRRMVGAYGAGRIVNPKTTRSQCIGGMIGGIGMALMEHAVVDARSGRIVNANLAEYAVPVHADAPPVMEVIFVQEHDPHVNPLGVKGVGEIAMVGIAPPSPTPSSTPPASASATCRSRRTSCFDDGPDAESALEHVRHRAGIDRTRNGARAHPDLLRLGQSHGRAGRQRRDPLAGPDVAAFDRNARSPASGKNGQSAFALARRAAASRFLDRDTRTLELQSLCHLLSRWPRSSAWDYLARPRDGRRFLF
jgi:xanthine dehydrogenase YagR molybdenum-binding subunit